MTKSFAPCSLAGKWNHELDPGDDGLQGRWFARSLDGSLSLPASLSVAGIGDPATVNTAWTGTIFDRSYFESPTYAKYREPGNIKVPFWLQPGAVYVGSTWYQREIEIPAGWSEKNVALFLERPHGQTRVWLNETEIGAADSLSTPHEFSLGIGLAVGRHRLTIRVDNRLHVEVGENAHSVSDHTQGNWNGIIGRIELRARTGWIEDLQVHSHVATRSVTVRGALGGRSAATDVTLQVRLRNGRDALLEKRVVISNGAFETELSLGANASLWDEFDPALYELHATVGDTSEIVLFGLREFSANGTIFRINGRETFLRGALDCCTFPLTGHPPMNVESWRDILGRIKSCGLNHVRFHSWCPPEAAFIAGDELGIYFQVECAVWPNSVAVLAFNSPSGIGDGNAVDRWAYEEGERILRAYGNHPCFVLMACGNEPGGPHHRDYLSAWVAHFRQRDGRRLYTGAAGWPELPGNEFHVIPNPRIHQWGDGLACRLNGQPPSTTHDYREIIAERSVPVVSHEIGQWCAYPPLYDTDKYRGHLKARNYEIFAESLAAHGMTDQLRDFVHASGRLQALSYKEEIEAQLRTPGLGGFQLLGLQDFSGQGTAPVGLLDAFWEEKGYLTAAEMRKFCGSTVPLARLKKRVFTTGETLEIGLEVAHFGPAPLETAIIRWELKDDAGEAARRGELSARTIPLGTAISLGDLSVDLADLNAPARYRLVVVIASSGGEFENDWDLWVYPDDLEVTESSKVVIARSLADAQTELEAGKTVLWMPQRGDLPDRVPFGFSPIFWNTACTQGQPPHTLGILCDPAHPVFADFPTDAHTNWQWWDLVRRATVFVLDELPPNLRPLVQVVDDWFTNRRLGLLFEARVGAGKLLACSIDLRENDERSPVARQLLRSLLAYLEGGKFCPEIILPSQTLNGLCEKVSPPA